jgi:hypothetical protein
MRNWGWAVAAIVALQGSIAQACAPYLYRGPVMAQARIRDAHGAWRKASVEANGTYVRIDYAARTTPWGRLVMFGDLEHGRAFVFPQADAGAVPREAQVTWKTSFDEAMPLVGLKPNFLGRLGDSAAPLQYFHGYRCKAARVQNQHRPFDSSICVSASGLPLFVRGADGRNVFEIIKLRMGPIAASQFAIPAAFAISDLRPKYLTTYSCSGWEGD